LKTIIQGELKMRKFLSALILFIAIGSFVFAQDTKKTIFPRIELDAGAGLSFGLMQATGNSTTDTLAGLATFFATLRGSAYGALRYTLTEQLSTGTRIGVYAVQYDNNGVSTFLIDFPVHGLLRFSLGSFAIEGFGGYYFSMLQSPTYNFGGLEIGAKLFLGGLYASYSYVAATLPYNRIEVGFQMTSIMSWPKVDPLTL